MILYRPSMHGQLPLEISVTGCSALRGYVRYADSSEAQLGPGRTMITEAVTRSSSPQKGARTAAYRDVEAGLGTSDSINKKITMPEKKKSQKCWLFLDVCSTTFMLVVLGFGGYLLYEKFHPKMNFILPSETREGDNYIGLIFLDENMSNIEKAAFLSAAQYWSSIISENRISPSTVRISTDVCMEGYGFKSRKKVDHLIILASIEHIDDRGSVLGKAGPCILDNGSDFPLIGQVQLDQVDVGYMITQGTLETVIIHEMAHVLGFGTLWPMAVQGGIRKSLGNSANSDLLQDPVLGTKSDENGKLVVLQTEEQPKFTGEAAVDEYSILTGSTDFYVPVEDGVENGRERFKTRADGAGSIDRHWDQDFFGNELMTFEIFPETKSHPVSRVTLASLQDMGYSVNLDAADPFTLRQPNSKFRGTHEKLYMQDDVFSWFDPFNLVVADPV